MTKSETLKELDLEELINTPFMDCIKIINFKAGETHYFSKTDALPAFYPIDGNLQVIIYKPEGGEFYIDLFPKEVRGVNINLNSNFNKDKLRYFEGDLLSKTDSILVTLPFDKLVDMELENKELILKKLLKLSVQEGIERSKHLFFKSIYSGDELLIKFLEKRKTLHYSTKDLSELLNINLRTLQRLIKNLNDRGIISKTQKVITLIDQEKLEIYKAEKN